MILFAKGSSVWLKFKCLGFFVKCRWPKVDEIVKVDQSLDRSSKLDMDSFCPVFISWRVRGKWLEEENKFMRIDRK